MSLLSQVVALVGRNGVVIDVVKKSETKDRVKVEATVQVASNDFRQQTYEVKKETSK